MQGGHLSTINLEARAAYFHALEEHWPEVLDTLLDDIMPLYEPRWHFAAGQRWQINTTWDKIQHDAKREDLLNGLQKWAARFRITEEWIFDAALETLMVYSPKTRAPGAPPSSERLWRCTPRGVHPLFAPKFDNAVWYPARHGWPEEWEAFRSRIESQFRSQLAEYRRMAELKFGTGKEQNIQRDARWTAKYQRGQTTIEIMQAEWPEGFTDTEQVIYRAVDRFAKSIGLNLRGRRRKSGKTTVQPTHM